MHKCTFIREGGVIMAKHSNLIYALKDGTITSISDVQSGLKCGCVCPACGAPLIARKGPKKMHHFAHHAGDNCEYGYESSLHLAAKDILSRSKKMIIPPVWVHFPGSPKKDELVIQEMEIEIDHVELEKRFGEIIPDIVVYSGGKYFFVEIFVTHQIDEDKLAKLKKLNISTIEIDLRRIEKSISAEDLSTILLNSDEKKVWKYNSTSNRWYQKFLEAADRKDLTSRGFAIHIDGCPIAVRKWRGKPYANFIDDCSGCEYCISYASDGYVLCSGRRRISTVKDFYVSEEVRVKESNAKIAERNMQSFVNGRCPNCGSQLIERNGKYGLFWGCSNYPHCRFTASIDPQTGEILMNV